MPHLCLVVVCEPFASCHDAAATLQLRQCAEEASAIATRLGRVDQLASMGTPGQRPGKQRWTCTVKNTFLDVQGGSGSQDDVKLSQLVKDLGPPAHFVRPCDIKPDELVAYRASHRKLRARGAFGASQNLTMK